MPQAEFRELAASIAHEVNQPLGSIVTNGEAALRWLAHSPPQLDEVRGSLRSMIDDAQRAGNVIQRIRTLAQNAEPERIRLDLNEVIDEVVALVHREVVSHRVSLRLDLASDLPHVPGDRIQLQQVIINLVMNGIQAMAAVDDRPRALLIRSRRYEFGQVLVAVQDSGNGVNPERAYRLFDAFFTTKPNGMGMGLWICRSIIAAHGGRIWFSDGGPGAVCQFTLPWKRENVADLSRGKWPLKLPASMRTKKKNTSATRDGISSPNRPHRVSASRVSEPGHAAHCCSERMDHSNFVAFSHGERTDNIDGVKGSVAKGTIRQPR
jgi:signal transduction histidine kinase